MTKNRIVALLLTIALLCGCFATVSQAASLPEVTFCLIQMDPYPSDEGIAQVEDAINAITEEKIGVHVNIEAFEVFEYQTNVVLRHVSGDPCDIFVESVPDSVAAGRATDVTDIMDANASEMIAALGDMAAAGAINGRTYGFPYGRAGTVGGIWMYRKDLVEQAGIEVGKITSYADLNDILAKLAEAYPDMYPCYVQGSNIYPFILSMKEYGLDTLSESTTFCPSGAVLLGEDSQKNLQVVNMYETPEFKKLCETTRDWYLKGYISPDAVAASEGNEAAMKSGKYASCFANGTNYIDPALFSNSCGYDMGVAVIGKYTQDTIGLNSVCWVISSQCKEPEAALRFLNLTYTDPEIANLVVWGVKDIDYVLTEEGRVRYPDGLDSSSVPYTCSAAAGYVGMQYGCYDYEGTPDIRALLADLTKDDMVSNAMGFNFDVSTVSNEISATSAIATQYMPGLITGTLDLDTAYPEFIKSLYDAGLQNIIDAKQQQLDAWATLSGLK